MLFFTQERIQQRMAVFGGHFLQKLFFLLLNQVYFEIWQRIVFESPHSTQSVINVNIFLNFHTISLSASNSHLMGMFYRTIRMVDNGLKPCYVFDGKPPEMKSGEVSLALLVGKYFNEKQYLYKYWLQMQFVPIIWKVWNTRRFCRILILDSLSDLDSQFMSLRTTN